MKKLLKYSLVIIFMTFLFSCDALERKEEITLTYLIKNNDLVYTREPGLSLLNEFPKLKVETTVTNTSEYGGVFKFYATLSSQGNVINFSEEQYISSGQTVTFIQSKEIDHYSFQANVIVDNWGITPPTKILTNAE